jgi:glycosyltransferase involved in cell wall biosynthesis
LEREGVTVQVINTRAGDPSKGLGERVQRLLVFSRIAVQAALAPQPVVHCHAVTAANLLGNGLVLGLGRLGGKKVVLTLHAGDLLEVLTNGGSLKHTLAHRFVGMAHAVTAVTPDLSDAVRALGARQVSYIPNAFRDFDDSADGDRVPEDTLRFIESHHPVVALVGAMRPVYGVDIFLKALSQVRADYPEIGAIIIAFKSVEPNYRAQIERLVSSLSLHNAVIFPQQLPNVLAVVSLADLFVRPTLQDGDSMAVREAQSLGVPVVASRVGFRPEPVVLFRPGDAADLAEKIQSAISDPPRPASSPEVHERDPVRAYLDVYASVMGTGAPERVTNNHLPEGDQDR